MPDIAHQYRTIVSGAGLRVKPDRGRLRVIGADRVSFLQALVTNDLIALKTSEGAYAAYLTPQGRMVSDLHIFIRPESVIADVPAALAGQLVEKLDLLVFSEDVQLADATASIAQIAVIGAQAAPILAAATGANAAALTDLSTWSQVDIAGGFIARTDDAEVASYDVFIEASRAAELIAALESAGGVPMSAEILDAIRVNTGRPAFGVDMTTDTIPLEAGLLERAISTTKGCYVGQEIVIRVLHRGGGRVARRLVKLDLSAGSDPAAPGSLAGTALSVEGKDIGVITSVAPALEGRGLRALGYVHRDVAEIGRIVNVSSQSLISATILGFAG